MNVIATYLIKNFPNGIEYKDAICLCLAMYCRGNVFSDNLLNTIELSQDNIAEAFSCLYCNNLIDNYDSTFSVEYGAFSHNPKDKGHWIEIMSSIMKLAKDYDQEQLSEIINSGVLCQES